MRSRIMTVVATIGLCTFLIAGPFEGKDIGPGRAALLRTVASPVATPVKESAAISVRGVIQQLPPLPAIVDLNRVQMSSGTEREIQPPGPILYWVEDGTLSIRVSGPAAVLMRAATDGTSGPPEEATPGVDYALRPGDSMLVMAQTPHIVRNEAQSPNSFVSAVVFPGSAAIPSWLSEAGQSGNINMRPLASDVVQDSVALPSGPAEITLTRVTLASGARFSLPDDTMFGFLVISEGTLTLGGGTGGSKQIHQAGEVVRLGSSTDLVAINDSDAPLVVLALRIDPARPDTTISG